MCEMCAKNREIYARVKTSIFNIISIALFEIALPETEDETEPACIISNSCSKVSSHFPAKGIGPHYSNEDAKSNLHNQIDFQ